MAHGLTYQAWTGLALESRVSHPFLSNWQSKNMVARIYTTMCFLTSTCQNASCFVIFQISNFVKRRRKVCRDFFVHLASARYVSLGHVVAIDPLIDSIPESSVDCWASAVLHLTGAFFLEMLPTTINLLGSCNFLSFPHSHLPSPFTPHVDHGLHHHAFGSISST